MDKWGAPGVGVLTGRCVEIGVGVLVSLTLGALHTPTESCVVSQLSRHLNFVGFHRILDPRQLEGGLPRFICYVPFALTSHI